LKTVKTIALYILFGLNNTYLFAQQNLVPNPSFEDTISCPTGYGQIYNAIGWDVLSTYGGGNPELYNTCCSQISGCGVPYNINNLGYQYPKSGNGYAGIDAAYYNGTLREYIQNKLPNKLIAGNTYCVSFYANLGNACAAFIKPLGAYLDDGEVVCAYNLGLAYANISFQLVNPQVYNTTQPFNDTLNWMKVEGSFTATGNEEYITIGNFFPDSLSDIDTGYAQVWNSYYYIDDVSVIDAGLPAYAGIDTVIHLEDSVFIGRQPEIGLNDDCIWFVDGIPIDTVAGMWVMPDSTTTYILQQTICSNVSYDTVTVIVDTANGIQEIYKTNFIKLYPNPNNGNMVLDYTLNKNEKANIIIYDIAGKKLASYILNAEQTSLPINEPALNNGVYYCTIVVNDDIVETKKIVILK
jgi:hypothetical protein